MERQSNLDLNAYIRLVSGVWFKASWSGQRVRHSMELYLQASLLIKQACYVSPAHPLVRHACLTAFIAFRMPLTPVIVCMSNDILHL
eukprot:jgi/Botrbrau1/10981/Bobra.0234s0006.1